MLANMVASHRESISFGTDIGGLGAAELKLVADGSYGRGFVAPCIIRGFVSISWDRKVSQGKAHQEDILVNFCGGRCEL